MAELLYATSHLAGTFTSPNNAVGDTPDWAGQLNSNTSETSRWAIGNPVNPLTAAATQFIRVLARKGSNSGIPTIALNLYENGSLVATILAATSVTSQVSQELVGSFSSSVIANRADVEIEVVMTAAGGSPSARNSAQIQRIQWEADTTAGAVVTGQAAVTASAALATSGTILVIESGDAAVAATATLAAAGVAEAPPPPTPLSGEPGYASPGAFYAGAVWTTESAGAPIAEGDAALSATASIAADGLIAKDATADVVATAAVPTDGDWWGAPRGLTATPVSATRIDLDWGAVAGASGYDIERDGVVIASDVTDLFYVDETGLVASTEYDYRVAAVR
jgi:hypothetical protein